MAISDWYSHASYPSQGAPGSSAAARAEFELIEASISARLPDLTSNANKVVIVAAGEGNLVTTAGTLSLPANLALSAYNLTITMTAVTAVTLPTSGTLYGTAAGSITSAQLLSSLSDKTGTGLVVFSTSPSLTTPSLGVASGTSLLLASDLLLGAGSITSVSGAISFGNENLTTTGTLASGTHTISSDMVISTGSITSASGAISFGNENLTTSGTLASGTHTISSDMVISTGSITSASGAISFGNENLSTTGTFGAGTTTVGVLSATTFNKVTITAPATGSTLTVADGKTLTASNTLTLTGTDAASIAFGTGGTVLYNGGALGTPSSATLTNATGLPIVAGTTGTLSVARGGTGVTSVTGTGVPVYDTSATITTPVLSGTVSGTYTLGGTPTFPASVVLTTGAQTLSSKTLTAPIINGVVGGTTTSMSITTMTGDVIGNVTGNVSGTAANVTGTVAVANGGTGQTSYTDGQLLIGVTAGNTLAKGTITAGTGIQVNNTGGGIEIVNIAGGLGVTEVSGTGSVQGLTLSGTVTTTGNITLGGSLSAVSLTTQVSGILPVANGGSGRDTATTAYGLIAAGTTAAGVHQTLPAGLTTEILVGGGAAALPVWTTASGSGAPLRATSPSITTPTITGAIGGTITSATITTMTGNVVGDVTGNVSGTAGNVTGTVAVGNGGTGRTTGTTAYALIATGTTAAGVQQSLAQGTTSQILVGGGAALPVWTTAEGTGAPVRAVSPSLTTPNIGVATATSVNKVAFTAPATGSTLTIANNKTLTASNSVTLAGTDGSTITFGTGGTVLYSGGALGTPSSGNLSSCTALPLGSVTGFGTGVSTALGVNIGTAGSFVTRGGALGTPSSGTLTSCTGLPAAGVVGTALVASAIGSTVQAQSTNLNTWAGVTPGTSVTTALVIAVGSAGAFVPTTGTGASGSWGISVTGSSASCTGNAATATTATTANALNTGNSYTVAGLTISGTAGFSSEYNNGTSGASKTITLTNGQKQRITLTANTTLTVSATSAKVGHYQIRVIQNGTGGWLVTWAGFSASRWLGSASAPAVNVASAGETIVTVYFDGTNMIQSMSKVGV